MLSQAKRLKGYKLESAVEMEKMDKTGKPLSRRGGAKLADGSILAADGQLAGTPSVLFDAVAIILSAEGAKELSMESAAIDFVRDAFGHLKAIVVDKGGHALLRTAHVVQDAGVMDINDKDAFIAAAKTRQWDREKSVRTLS